MNVRKYVFETANGNRFYKKVEYENTSDSTSLYDEIMTLASEFQDVEIKVFIETGYKIDWMPYRWQYRACLIAYALGSAFANCVITSECNRCSNIHGFIYKNHTKKAQLQIENCYKALYVLS